jgi:hypothetical protein
MFVGGDAIIINNLCIRWQKIHGYKAFSIKYSVKYIYKDHFIFQGPLNFLFYFLFIRTYLTPTLQKLYKFKGIWFI